MRAWIWGAVLGITCTAPLFARDIKLGLPLDCTPGQDCFLLNLMDADPSKGAADHHCGPLTYDGHTGTDFALPSHAAMARGVKVLAAAPGRVRAVRVDMPDHDGDLSSLSTEGRECGNGVVIDHGGGWETQYCHLRQGSPTVSVGDAVRMGQDLGLVGLSGQSEYPHLHLSLRKDGLPIDPFHPDTLHFCSAEANKPQLWQDPIPYPQGAIVSSGLAPYLVTYDQVKSGQAALDRPTPQSPSLMAWSMVHAVRTDDILRLRITGPDGLHIQNDTTFDKPQVLAYRAAGRRSDHGWPAGQYKVTSWLIRDNRVLDHHQITVEITP